jgi:hypothetical protein
MTPDGRLEKRRFSRGLRGGVAMDFEDGRSRRAKLAQALDQILLDLGREILPGTRGGIQGIEQLALRLQAELDEWCRFGPGIDGPPPG